MDCNEGMRKNKQKLMKELNAIRTCNMRREMVCIGHIKKILLKAVKQVVGTKAVTVRKRKRNGWWTDVVRKVVKQKREAYMKSIMRNVPEPVRNKRKR